MTIHFCYFSQHEMCHIQSQWLFASLCIIAYFLEALPITSFAEVQPCNITAQEVRAAHSVLCFYKRKERISWQSNGWGSTLPLQEAQAGSLVREIRSRVLRGIAIK